MTPMQRFMLEQQQKKRAETALKAPELMQAEDSLHIRLIALDHDIKRLRSLPVMADRQLMKRDELLPRWEPVAQSYIDSGKTYKNPIFVYCIIWLLDVRRFQQALDWADLAIAQGQETPDNIKSNLPSFVAAQIYDWAVIELESGRSAEPFLSRTFKNVAEKWRLNEKITAKYYRLTAFNLLTNSKGEIRIADQEDSARLKLALDYLIKARQLYSKSPVKTAIDRIKMRIRALECAADFMQEPTTQPPGDRSAEGLAISA